MIFIYVAYARKYYTEKRVGPKIKHEIEPAGKSRMYMLNQHTMKGEKNCDQNRSWLRNSNRETKLVMIHIYTLFKLYALFKLIVEEIQNINLNNTSLYATSANGSSLNEKPQYAPEYTNSPHINRESVM